jgi:hypothetical protein
MSAEEMPIPEERSHAGRYVGRYLMWGFAAIGLAAALSVIYLAAALLNMNRGNPEPSKVAGKAPSEQYSVQDVEDVRGTDLVKIEIGIGAPGGDPYSSSSDSDQRNLILLDRRTGANRRLLPDNSRHVALTWFFPAAVEDPAAEDKARAVEVAGETAAKAPPPPYAYYVLAVRQAKGRLNDLLIGDLASGRQAFVLNGINGVDKIWMLSPTRLAVLMRADMRLHYRVIDIPTLKIVLARQLDIG